MSRGSVAVRLVAGLAALLILPSTSAAQASDASPFPEWARDWRPLAPLAELPLEFPGARTAPDLVLAPPRRIGHLWTVGNPAGLRREVRESWTAFALGRDARSGEYRRPLDPAEQDVDRLRALSWTRLGDWGAAAGELDAGRDLRGPSSFADFFEPHRGTPFVVTDTGSFDMRHIFARLEGALGVELGEWGLGVSAGYEANEDRTRESPFLRAGQQEEYAATVGAVRSLAGGRLVVGAHLRGRGSAEDWILNPVAQAGVAHLIEGLAEPERVAVGLCCVFRRIETRGVAGGLSLGGRAGAFDWVLFGELGHGQEEQASQQRAESTDPLDRWERDALRLGGALQRPIGRRLLLTLDGEWTTLDGEATVPDIGEPVFVVDQSRLSAAGELRLLLPEAGGGWGAGLRLGFRHEPWEQVDRLVELRSDLEMTRPEASASLARRFGDDVTLAGSYGIAFHDASGTLPPPEEQGPAYRRLIAPFLAVHAAPATAQAAGGTLLWQASPRLGFWLQGRFETVSPDEGSDLEALPMGEREAYGLSVGVVLWER